jgi:general L-amino acid transport system substrate-binding protein
LKAVKERGTLVCGVSNGLLGFSSADEKGSWTGFDVDACRAVAAAVFNDANKVQFVALQTEERFSALQGSKIDLLARNATWTISRESSLGLLFTAVTYYDGLGFLVRRDRKIDSALELDGAKVCTLAGTTTELNLTDYFHANHMRYTVLTFATPDESAKAYFNIVKWSMFAMLDAEELGVSQKTIADALKSDKPEVRRLVGAEGNFGEQLGLTNDWAARIVALVGNYGEVFDRNLGTGSKLGIPRGLNGLWNNGGIQYAPPIR